MLRQFLIFACLFVPILPAADPPWLGTWQEATNADDLLRFEPERCILKNPGEPPRFACAAYGQEGDIWLRLGGTRGHLKVRLQGEQLVLVSGGIGIYHRLSVTPDALKLIPLAIPAAKSVGAERKKAIIAEASKRLKDDQAVRKAGRAQGGMEKMDADNTAWIKTLIAEVGWLDAGRFGKETASAMFLLVQHSGDLPLMLGALPYIEKDLKAKVCDPQDFALLYDRVQMMTGRPQRYGSQIVPDDGRPTIYLLEDRTKVEAFRQAIGLFPLQVYLHLFEQQTHAKLCFMEQVRFSD